MSILNKISVFFRLLILFLFFIISLIPLLINNENAINYIKTSEKFNHKLSKYNSIDKCTKYIDSTSHFLGSSTAFDTLGYVNEASNFFKERFYHGLSNYSISENWIANISGRILWSHLSAVVDPDDILKYSHGLCSQQNIAFTEVLKIRGITTRSVGLGTKKGPGHFLTEVLYNGSWHLYDIDIEPNWDKTEFKHISMDSLMKNKELLYSIYENKLEKNHLNIITKNIKYGIPNEFQAKNMLLFHRLTKTITYIIPIFLGIIIIITLYKQKVPSKIIQKTASKLKSKEKEAELIE